jgi:MFS family permease
MLNATERKVITLTGGAHWVVHAAMLALPASAVLLKAQFGLDDFTYGLLANLAFLGFGLGALPAGLLVDRIGARKTLRLCIGGLALGSVMVALSTDLWLLAVGVGLMGLAAGLYHPSGLTLVSANLRRDGRGMGYHGIAGSVGLASGNFIGAGVLAVAGWPHLFGLYAALGLVILAYQLGRVRRIELAEPHTAPREEPRREEGTGRRALRVALALAVMALLGFSYRGLVVFMPLYFAENLHLPGLTEEVLGNLATGVMLLGGVLGQFSGGFIAEKKKPLRSAGWLALAACAAALGGRFAGGWWTLAISVGMAAAVFSTQPITNSLVGRLMPARHRGKGYGLAGAVNFGFGSLAGSAGGWVAQNTGLENVFLLLAGSALLAALAIMLLRKTGADEVARPRRAG